MGPLAPRSTAEITRAVYARGLPPPNLFKLVRANAKTAGIPLLRLQKEVCGTRFEFYASNISCTDPIYRYTDILIELLFAAPPPISTIILSYVQHAVVSQTSSVLSLVNPAFLAREALLSFNPSTNVAILDGLMESVHEGFGSRSEMLVWTDTTTLNETLKLYQAASTSPTILYILHIFSFPPVPIIPSPSTLDAREACLEATKSALDVLSTFVCGPTSYINQLKLQLSSVASLIKSPPPALQSCPFNLGQSLIEADADVAFLVSDLNHRKYTPEGICNTSYAVARLFALLKARIHQAEYTGSTPTGALEDAILEILLAFSVEIRRDEHGENLPTVAIALLCSRLPYLVMRSFEDVYGLKALVGSERAKECFVAALRRFKSILLPGRDDNAVLEHEKSCRRIHNLLVLKCCQLHLISVDEGASLARDLSTNELEYISNEEGFEHPVEEKNFLTSIPDNIVEIGPFFESFVLSFAAHPESYNLSSTAASCRLLLLPGALEICFLHVEPKSILAPLGRFLDTFDTSRNNFREGHPVEDYGTIVLFVLTAVTRFNLHVDLAYHLGPESTFTSSWLSSLSAVYPLNGMDVSTSETLQGWIKDLFGEGISDELMQSTDPRVLLRIAPTLAKQSLAACQAGVIDLDTLREGLSYLLQDILSFTLPGVLLWLIAEIARGSSTTTESDMIEILQVFIYADNLPPSVLDFISPSLDALALKLSARSTSPLDVSRVSKLVAPYFTRTSNIPSQSTWLQQLSSDISSIIEYTSSPQINLSQTLHHSLAEDPAPTIADTIMSTVLYRTEIMTAESPESAWRRKIQTKRLGRALLGVSTRRGYQDSRSWPVLEIMKLMIPGLLRTLSSGDSFHTDAMERERTEMLAGMMGSAFREAAEVGTLVIQGGVGRAKNLMSEARKLADAVLRKGSKAEEEGLEQLFARKLSEALG